MTLTTITKRNGTEAVFEPSLIEKAISKACDSVGSGEKDFIQDTTAQIVANLEKRYSLEDASHRPSVEDVQDAVEKQLMREDRFEIAKAYILYREDQRERRLEEEQAAGPKVKKADGTFVSFDASRIAKSIERACEGLSNVEEKVAKITEETRITTYDGISEEEIDEATINTALQNVKDDIEYDTLATRILAKTAYKRVLGDFSGVDKAGIQKLHEEQFPAHIKSGIKAGILHKKMAKLFDLEKLAHAIDVSRDDLFVYSGLSTLLHRYSLKKDGDIPFEVPQYMFMRVAMGLSYVSKDPTAQAIAFYDRMSEHRYISGGSTNIGAGTNKSALSNCFLIQMEDDMEHISKTVSDVMLISKATGGLGVSVSKLRASGSPLAQGGASTGPTTFAKIMDTAIRAIQRGGKKKGALAFYMENWHLDFPEFVDWRHNAGDDYLRMRTANTASFISDEFMHRVAADQEWYMFDPKETPDLIELYGKAFSKRYKEYVKLADAGKMRTYKTQSAVALWKKMLVSLQGTAHPWVTFKDAMNVRALNNNTGTIHMSNLCTEICLPQDKDNIAVCNLASINITAHLTDKKKVDWDELEKTVRTGITHLDNLVDINELPVKEAAKSDKENRAVGLGVMGIADALEQMGMAYDSKKAYDVIDQIFEFVSYMAIDESANIAKAKGSYPNFKGSEWSKGHVPIDSLTTLLKERGKENLTIDMGHKFNVKGRELDWKGLRKKVKKGIRNATLMAVAPNANIGLLVGTVPGMDVRFAQVFSRNKFSGKYLDINHNLVGELEELGLWEQTREQILEHQGDIAQIEEIPQEVRDRYKTSFSTSPEAMIEVAARAQKWIDQAISRNIYLETRDIGEIMEIYMTAWKKGLKSTYYLHMKPRHTAEQSTVKVNKGASLGKKGFGGLKAKSVATTKVMHEDVKSVAPKGFGSVKTKSTAKKSVASAKPKGFGKKATSVSAPPAALVDPADLSQCDSCQ